VAVAAKQQFSTFYDWDQVPVVCTVEEARHVLGVSRETMYRLIRSGEVPSQKVGERRRVILKTVLREYLADVDQWRNEFAEDQFRRVGRFTTRARTACLAQVSPDCQKGGPGRSILVHSDYGDAWLVRANPALARVLAGENGISSVCEPCARIVLPELAAEADRLAEVRRVMREANGSSRSE
jgi:excisionase family DNA binding protein